MATKTISIMDDAYDLLKRAKQKDESFSDVIRRTLTQKQDASNAIGKWGNLTVAEEKKMYDAISKARNTRRRYV